LVSVGLTLQGIFLTFQEHLLCICSTLVFKKLFFTVLQQQTAFLHGKVPAINILLSEHKSGQTRQAANSLLLAREHSPDVNNKPIEHSLSRLPLEHYNIQFESGTLIPINKRNPSPINESHSQIINGMR